MDAVEFAKAYKRMCDMESTCIFCEYRNELLKVASKADSDEFCAADCAKLTIENAGFASPWIEDWLKKHPRKTRVEDFLEKFPRAPISKGVPTRVCPRDVGYMCEQECNRGKKISACWNEPVED